MTTAGHASDVTQGRGRRWSGVAVAAALGVAVDARPASLACDVVGTDAAAVAATRRVVEAACPCDDSESHREYVRCTRAVVRLRIGAGELPRGCAPAVRRLFAQSTCSHREPRVACCEEKVRRGSRRCRVRPAARCLSNDRVARRACEPVAFCADTHCGKGTRDEGGRDATCAPELLYGAEGNRLRRYDVDTILAPPLAEDVLIERASLDPDGRDVNGQICPLPDGSGRFVAGEDTGQPSPPPGWGVFEADGTQVGKLTATYFVAGAEPFGCAFDAAGRLFTSEVGSQASGAFDGQLVMWFPPYDRFPGPPGAYPDTDEPSGNFCKLATDVGTAGSVAVDAAGRVYVASARGFQVLRFTPPFPTGPDAAGGCGGVDALGSPVATAVAREVFAAGVITASGIVRAPGGGWFIGSVLTGMIAEHDATGGFVRRVLESPPDAAGFPLPYGHPQGLARDCRGNLYYADLALVESEGGAIGPGPNGSVRRIAFDVCGRPAAPAVVRDGLAFPDGLGILPGDLEASP